MKSSAYTARWYNRGNAEDPGLSLNDHGPAIGQGNIIYGENKFGGTHARAILPKHSGANVWIRKTEMEPATTQIWGGGWTLVRHVPAGNAWHPAKDSLAG